MKDHRKTLKILVVSVCIGVLASCSEKPARSLDPEIVRTLTEQVNDARILAADSHPGDWAAHGRTYSEQRHSLLDQVNDGNVPDLALAWYADTDTRRGLEASPIVVDGVMFTTGSWSLVYAHDAATGELLWKHDPQVPRAWGINACCDVVNRGVAVWKGRVYVGTLDGRLVALDSGDGTVVWERQTTDPEKPYTITGAPRVMKDMIIIGNGGAEYGVRGYITAYDTDTGEQLWRFHTVPGNPAKPTEGKHLDKAMDSWRGDEWWKIGGGGTVWDSMAYDAELNLLYIGVGNGSPWNRYVRSPGGGDNLYLSSIIAINPDSGEMAWYYQTTPGDTWDYTATQHMILADIEIDGKLRKVIMQAPKNGFFYVLDRTDGSFISARPYVPVTWASHVDPETGRPVENPQAHYADKPKRISPSPYGGHNWHPMAYNPDTGLVYIPALELEFVYGQQEVFSYNPNTWNTGLNQDLTAPAGTIEEQAEALGNVRGHLAAWDPVQQKETWRVQHSGSWNGGVLSTAGNLVFQGRADGFLAAYRADTGELLWETPTHTGIIAPPVTYTVDGEQYIVVQTGWGGAFGLASGVPRQKGNFLQEGRLLAYKLGGKASLPEPRIEYQAVPEPPADVQGTEDQIAFGESLYHQHCSVCHGPGAAGSGVITDLRHSREEVHAAWDQIVLGGAYTSKGMAAFGEVIDMQESRAIQVYVAAQARTSRLVCNSDMLDDYPGVFDGICERPVSTGGNP